MTKTVRLGLALTAAAIFCGTLILAGFYFSGNVVVKSRLCELGLPNATMPPRYRGDGTSFFHCAIYGPRTRFMGIFYVSAESSGFYPYRLAEESVVRGDLIGDALQHDKESDPEHLLDKFFQGPFGGKTLATFDGWRTIYPGRYRQVSGHDHEILVDRFIKAEPAPVPTDADYARLRRLLKSQH